jgi:hypothetical protein
VPQPAAQWAGGPLRAPAPTLAHPAPYAARRVAPAHRLRGAVATLIALAAPSRRSGRALSARPHSTPSPPSSLALVHGRSTAVAASTSMPLPAAELCHRRTAPLPLVLVPARHHRTTTVTATANVRANLVALLPVPWLELRRALDAHRQPRSAPSPSLCASGPPQSRDARTPLAAPRRGRRRRGCRTTAPPRAMAAGVLTPVGHPANTWHHSTWLSVLSTLVD